MGRPHLSKGSWGLRAHITSEWRDRTQVWEDSVRVHQKVPVGLAPGEHAQYRVQGRGVKPWAPPAGHVSQVVPQGSGVAVSPLCSPCLSIPLCPIKLTKKSPLVFEV